MKKSQLSDIMAQAESSYILDVYLYCKDKLTSESFL